MNNIDKIIENIDEAKVAHDKSVEIGRGMDKSREDIESLSNTVRILVDRLENKVM